MNDKAITDEQKAKLKRLFDLNNKIESDEDLIALAGDFEEDE